MFNPNYLNPADPNCSKCHGTGLANESCEIKIPIICSCRSCQNMVLVVMEECKHEYIYVQSVGK